MGPTVINGLPAHVLLVHAVVVLVPLAAILLVLSALWPAARRRLGILTPIAALVAVVVIPPTTHAGEWLIRRVDRSPTLHTHAELADTMLPWAAGMFVAAVAVWVLFTKPQWLTRRSAPAPEKVLVGGAAGKGETGEGETAEGAARPRDTEARLPGWLSAVRVVAMVLAVVVSVGSVVDVYLIGDSGAKSAWTGGFSATPTSGKG
ncbi:MAG TPA: hypothetical protein VHF06_03595 [Pseudonocardiaceae bacterium]|jgi:hypothetical protein|nr:hypothetical protein [Pseudonocardiaceae bacterium]